MLNWIHKRHPIFSSTNEWENLDFSKHSSSLLPLYIFFCPVFSWHVTWRCNNIKIIPREKKKDPRNDFNLEYWEVIYWIMMIIIIISPAHFWILYLMISFLNLLSNVVVIHCFFFSFICIYVCLSFNLKTLFFSTSILRH